MGGRSGDPDPRRAHREAGGEAVGLLGYAEPQSEFPGRVPGQADHPGGRFGLTALDLQVEPEAPHPAGDPESGSPQPAGGIARDLVDQRLGYRRYLDLGSGPGPKPGVDRDRAPGREAAAGALQTAKRDSGRQGRGRRPGEPEADLPLGVAGKVSVRAEAPHPEGPGERGGGGGRGGGAGRGGGRGGGRDNPRQTGLNLPQPGKTERSCGPRLEPEPGPGRRRIPAHRIGRDREQRPERGRGRREGRPLEGGPGSTDGREEQEATEGRGDTEGWSPRAPAGPPQRTTTIGACSGRRPAPSATAR